MEENDGNRIRREAVIEKKPLACYLHDETCSSTSGGEPRSKMT